MDTTFRYDQVHANTIMCGEETYELAVYNENSGQIWKADVCKGSILVC
jgi:hypothetical protein